MAAIPKLSESGQALADSMATIGARMAALPSLSDASVGMPHPTIVAIRRDEFRVLIIAAEVWDRCRDLLSPFADDLARFTARLVVVGTPRDPDLSAALNRGVGALLSEDPTDEQFLVAFHQAFEFMAAKARSESRGKWLNRYRYELGELIEISRALTTEREIKKLLDLILEKSRFVTGADAGSVYVVEGDDRDLHRRQLRFKLSQNDSLSFDSSEFTMPISRGSMAGYVALEQTQVNIADVYRMPAGAPFGFDRSFDEKVGYRTQSMLCTPLVTSKGEVIGVLQLINKKREPQKKLLERADFEEQVVPFDERSEQLLATLAAQAGIALENAILYDEIRSIFEGFVRASVDAIEARDPTTSGHSRRVSELTVGLAKAVERVDGGPYREVHWTLEDVRELEYASLLHDFGKIGVREHVLVKAKKLYPHDLSAVNARLDFVLRSLEVEVLQRKLELLRSGAPASEIRMLDEELTVRRQEITEARQTITQANEPTVLAEGDFRKIEELGRRTFSRLDGTADTFLRPEEVKALSVTRGSLTVEEFDEIRSHVSHTYRFLSQIPWGKSFSRVAVIAGAHHERLNGTGYPNRLRAEEIPLQSKMMTISDIFDALTASDRPYKRAVPLEKALDILGFEVKNEHIDGELVRIFREAKVWEPVLKART